MSRPDLATPVSITLPFDDWCLLIGVLSSIIESSILLEDPIIKEQLKAFARIREAIDKATDL